MSAVHREMNGTLCLHIYSYIKVTSLRIINTQTRKEGHYYHTKKAALKSSFRII